MSFDHRTKIKILLLFLENRSNFLFYKMRMMIMNDEFRTLSIIYIESTLILSLPSGTRETRNSYKNLLVQIPTHSVTYLTFVCSRKYSSTFAPSNIISVLVNMTCNHFWCYCMLKMMPKYFTLMLLSFKWWIAVSVTT